MNAPHAQIGYDRTFDMEDGTLAEAISAVHAALDDEGLVASFMGYHRDESLPRDVKQTIRVVVNVREKITEAEQRLLDGNR